MAIRTASSSSSNGMTTSTGPKISSWAIVIELSTSVKSVGLTKNPLSKPFGGLGAADQHRRALVDTLLDVAEDALRCLSEMTGPHSVPGSCGSPGDDALVHRLEDRDALVVARPRQQHPGRRWRSPGRRACTARCRSGRPCEVGVLQHDRRRLAAEFEEQPLHRRGALLHDPLADDGRTGERDQVDLGRERELLADEVVGRGDDVDDTRWDVGLLGDQPADPGGVERRVRAPASARRCCRSPAPGRACGS